MPKHWRDKYQVQPNSLSVNDLRRRDGMVEVDDLRLGEFFQTLCSKEGLKLGATVLLCWMLLVLVVAVFG